MHLQVLGPGCGRCHALEARTTQAVAELGLDATVEAVTAFAEIARHGIMTTPALVVDDRVVVAGRVPEVSELVSILGGG